MGRSEKKIRSNHVNALRKKYDAYLEEDKKRKERNEYILEKLDKMRCCTALVQVRNKHSLIEDHRQPAHYNLSNPTLENPSYQPIPSSNHIYFPSETPSKLIDESTLLQEISKKYILIPKTRPESNKKYLLDVKPEKDENNDWKSKYNILEQLKKSEKEEPVSMNQATCEPENKKNTEKLALNENFEPEPSISDQSQRYQHDYYSNDNEPVKEANIVNIEKELNINKYNNHDTVQQYDYSDEVINNEMTPLNINETSNRYDNFDEVNNGMSPQENFNNTDNMPLPNENVNTVVNSLGDIQPDTQDYFPVADKYNVVVQKEYKPGDHYSSNIEDENAIPTIHSNELVEEINRDMTHENHEDTTEKFEYPIEVINIQDFTPRDDVNVHDGVNVNSEPELVLQASGDVSYYNPDTNSISNNEQEKSDNTFDPIVVTDNTDLAEAPLVDNTYAENTDNYYDEQTNENFTYDENNAVENYNAEYPAHNQNYNQEEYTAYYEGVQTEQPYVTESNEDDATLQRYDQNYQQQYGEDYNPQEYQQGYEQQYAEQGYEQNEYTEQSELDNTQQEIPQYDIQGDTPQYVEQVLDNEEGYIVEKQNEEVEISGVEKTLNPQAFPIPTDQQQVNNAQ